MPRSLLGLRSVGDITAAPTPVVRSGPAWDFVERSGKLSSRAPGTRTTKLCWHVVGLLSLLSLRISGCGVKDAEVGKFCYIRELEPSAMPGPKRGKGPHVAYRYDLLSFVSFVAERPSHEINTIVEAPNFKAYRSPSPLSLARPPYVGSPWTIDWP